MAGKLNKGKIINAAQKYVQKGQYDRAIREYTKIVEEDPRDVRIWLKIGDLCARKGDKHEAVETYLKVAEFYSEQGFYLKAVAVYKQILKIDPSRTEVNLRLAELYKQLGLLNDAMQQYEVVSNYLTQAGRTKEALTALRQIVDMAPDNVASRIKLAELCSKEQMRAEAIEEFSKAADYLRANNRLDDFIKVAERLVYHEPENLLVVKELAGLYLRRKDPRRALQKLQLAFKADPRDEETLDSLAQAFQHLGQVAKTVSVLRELAHVHRENGATARQMETYRRMLDLAPDDAEARQAVSSGGSLQQGPIVPVASETFPPVQVPTAARPNAVRSPSNAPMGVGPDYVDPLAPDVGHGAPDMDVGPVSAAASGQQGDLEEEVTRVLAEADVYIKYGLHDKATDHLRQIFGRDPNNVPVRLKLRDLYVQLGRFGDAAHELFAVARFVAPGDRRAAMQYLDEALRLEPQNDGARELLAELEGQAQEAAEPERYELHEESVNVPTMDSYEEIDEFEEVMSIDIEQDIVEEIPIEASGQIQLDPAVEENRFEDTTTAHRSGPDLAVDYSGDDGSRSLELIGETTDTLGTGTPSADVIRLPAKAEVSDVQQRIQAEEETVSIEDDLEEAEFFLQQGLVEEARSILEELATRVPHNQLVQSKLEELDPVLQAVVESGDAPEGDLAADLAEELRDPMTPEPEDKVSAEYSVEEVFGEFRRGLASQVGDEDSDTHYDLGIAYREMGLLDDAISEFKRAMRSREKEVLCHMMIGLCQVEKGLIGEAINQFKTGLYVDGITDRETIALYFELGQAYERLDDHPEALYYYEKVEKRDPDFRDVTERVGKLRENSDKGGNGNGGVGAAGGPGGDIRALDSA